MLLPRIIDRSRNVEKCLESKFNFLFSMIYTYGGRLTGRCTSLRSLFLVAVLVLLVAKPVQSQEPAATVAHPVPTDA